MLDFHEVPFPNWGVRPILFEIGNFQVSSYSFCFHLLLLLVLIILDRSKKTKVCKRERVLYYNFCSNRGGDRRKTSSTHFILESNCLKFSRLVDFTFRQINCWGINWRNIGSLFIKHKLKIKSKFGNLVAPSIALGVAIGRIGCFLRGCCYGKPTSLPWGINFGDGILRIQLKYMSRYLCLDYFFFNVQKNQKSCTRKLV
jgi:phosphatidylglycerol:prolipoprotein diacylglycerol transferase